MATLRSMIEMLHELKNSSCYHRSIQAFDNVWAGKKENKSLLDFYTQQKTEVFSRTLRALPIL